MRNDQASRQADRANGVNGRRRQLIYERQTGRLRSLSPDGPTHSSAPLPWRGCLLEQHRGRDLQAHDAFLLDTLIFVYFGPPTRFEWEQDGRGRFIDLRDGQVSVVPGRLVHSARLPGPAELVTLSLEPSVLTGRAQPPVTLDETTLQPGLALDDAYTRESLLLLRCELDADSPDTGLLAESVAAALALRVIRQFAFEPMVPLKPAPPVLPGPQLATAVDFIEAGLGQRISLREIADAVGLSPFHFARSFRATTGVSPYQYVLRRRVERARDLLLRGLDPAQAAVNSGFADQSHLTTHFKRRWGVTPRAFLRRKGRPSAGV